MGKIGKIIALIITFALIIKILLVSQDLFKQTINIRNDYNNYYNELESIYDEL